MRVKIANRYYRMSREAYKGLLKIASEQVPLGVYAVEKGNYAEMRADRCQSRNHLKQLAREYKGKGFKVYANGR